MVYEKRMNKLFIKCKKLCSLSLLDLKIKETKKFIKRFFLFVKKSKL